MPNDVTIFEESVFKLQQRADLTSLFQSLYPYFNDDVKPSEAVVNLKLLEGIYAVLQPFDPQSRLILLDIIEDRHQKRSTTLISQIPVKQWYDIIGEKTIADAVPDRITHHSLRLELYGESLRRRKSKSDNVFL